MTLYRQVINRMHLLRRRSFSSGNAASHREHRAMVAALANRDAAAAAAVMRKHVENGFERMRQGAARDKADSSGDAQRAPSTTPRQVVGTIALEVP